MFGGWSTTASVHALRLVLGAAMAVYSWSDGSRWYVALLSGALGGLVFGSLAARRQEIYNTGLRAATGSEDPTVQRAAVVAARRGPVPQDPRLRRGALGVLRYQQQAVVRNGRSNLWTSLAAACVCVVLALVWSPWWGIGAVLSGVGAAMQARIPHRLAHRADLLDHADADGS